MALRERQKRNLLATLLLAQGTPMLLAGDEFGRTQDGNNNAYCQDNEITWLDWEQIRRGRAAAHRVRAPADRVAQGASGAPAHPLPARPRGSPDGVKDITWFSPAGREKTAEQWQDRQARCLGLMLNGRAGERSHARRAQPADDDVLLIVLNAYHDVVPFTLPSIAGGSRLAPPARHDRPRAGRGRDRSSRRCNHSACPDVPWFCSSAQPR